jgi:TolA protein
MTEPPNRDAIWPIGLALSAALHGGGLYYVISHAKIPGATDIPTAAISVSLTPTRVLDSMNDTGAVETAGSGMLGEGGQAASEPEQTLPDPDADAKERQKAEVETRENAEAEAKAVAEEQKRAETEAREREEAKARALAEAREKAETEARARAEQEAKALAEARANTEIAARARAEAEARTKEAEARATERERAETEAREKEKEKEKADRRKLAEVQERKEQEEAKEEQERRAEAAKRKKQRDARAPGGASSGNTEKPRRPESGRVSASTGELLNYKARVRSHIARNLPRGRSGGSGNIAFNIRLGESGEVLAVRILRSTGNAQLDQAALAALRQAAPFPRAPQNTNAGERTFESYFTFR